MKMASDKKVVTLEDHEQRLMGRGLADFQFGMGNRQTILMTCFSK